MSRLLRSQVSLIFENEDLFDNFITPLKKNKELSGTIIRLLQAYYESEEVRSLVDGVSFGDVVEGGDKVLDSSEAMDKINQMRQTLAMQDFLFTQAEQVLSDGACEMDTLMRTNDIARRKGFMKTESTDVGEALVHLSLEDLTSESKNGESSEHIENSSLEGRVDKIESVLGDIMSTLKSIQNTFSSSSISITTEDTDNQDNQETPISNSNNEVFYYQSVESENSSDISGTANLTSKESVSKTEDEGIFVNEVPHLDSGISEQISSNDSTHEVESTQVGIVNNQIEFTPQSQGVSIPDPVVVQSYPTIPEPVDTLPYATIPEPVDTLYTNTVQEEDATDTLASMLEDLL